MNKDNDKTKMRQLEFIWGWSKNMPVTPSFLTWDDIYIYYNPKQKRYYYHVDTDVYNYVSEAVARGECERLSEIDEAFRNFLIEKGLPLEADICFEELAHEGAYTLSALYTKFKIKIEGYKYYVNNKPQS